jgi:DNA (cytosine-5)-methyltransferase 1
MLKDRGLSARGTDAPWYRGWNLTDEERAVFRATTVASQAAKRRALNGECNRPKHPINQPRLDPCALMPAMPGNGLTALSLFSGGGGLDIGFDRAGYTHVASYEILEGAAAVISEARPTWRVNGGEKGDVTGVDWSPYRGGIDVLHGGPPCQPFSHAGHRQGPNDVRNLIPEFIRAVLEIRPKAFLFENVVGLRTKAFASYIDAAVVRPLSKSYRFSSFHRVR